MPQIPCKEIAKQIMDGLKSRPTPKKILAAILVGKNPASISFLKQKQKAAEELGIDFKLYEFPEDISQNELLEKIKTIAGQENAGGIIIQLPLPEHLESQEILDIIPAEKDIDVLGSDALNKFRAGQNKISPPAAGVVEAILNILPEMKNKNRKIMVTVIGLGKLIGSPISIWLEQQKDRQIYPSFLRRGGDFSILKDTDIIISGAGRAGIIKPDMVKQNSIIIDFGYDMSNSGKVSGDFDADQLSNYATTQLKYTPTPGGTGPILVAKIMENFYNLNNER